MFHVNSFHCGDGGEGGADGGCFCFCGGGFGGGVVVGYWWCSRGGGGGGDDSLC